MVENIVLSTLVINPLFIIHYTPIILNIESNVYNIIINYNYAIHENAEKHTP
ncbi:hypothetical protein psyc5s11_29190 [Clostridium gelidum]|uniref:Uncharacterized protein n=1 Tax=Clostridium gelidum TaxID=704125 RepID=A0ABN6IXK4_9CLOT|nr:hypothetical protein psyc5s11_29190 [Clostridium gelidum]